MARKYEVTAVTGKYTDSSGAEKSRYQTLGSVIETKNGLMLKLESVPIGWDGWAYLNAPKPREGQQAPHPAPALPPAQRAAGGGFDDLDSDVPFRDPLSYRGAHLAL